MMHVDSRSNLSFLTVAQANIVANLNLSDSNNADAIDYQKELKQKLAVVYTKGAPGVAKNIHKAKQYTDELDSTILNPENIYSAFSWWTLARLFVSGLNDVLELLGSAFLHPFFRATGFSYGVSFVYRLRQLVNKNSLKEEGVVSGLVNDGLWFVTNLTCFILSGGLSAAAIVTTSLAFDVCHATYSYFAVAEHEKTLAKIVRAKNISRTKEDFLKFQNIELVLRKEIKEVKKERIKSIITSVAILVGVAMMVFSPAGPILAVGTALLMAANIFSGFGAKVWNIATGFFQNKKPAAIRPVTQLKPVTTSNHLIHSRIPDVNAKHDPTKQHQLTKVPTFALFDNFEKQYHKGGVVQKKLSMQSHTLVKHYVRSAPAA